MPRLIGGITDRDGWLEFGLLNPFLPSLWFNSMGIALMMSPGEAQITVVDQQPVKLLISRRKLRFNDNLYSEVGPKGSGREGENISTQAVIYRKCSKVIVRLELASNSKLKSAQRTRQVKMK